MYTMQFIGSQSSMMVYISFHSYSQQQLRMMAEREDKTLQQYCMTPGWSSESINMSPPLPDELNRETFLKEYECFAPILPSPPPLTPPPPSPLEHRIALSDKYKCFRRKVQPYSTRDPRQSIAPSHTNYCPYPKANIRMATSPTVATVGGQSDPKSQSNEWFNTTSNNDTFVAMKRTFEDPTLKTPSYANLSTSNIRMVWPGQQSKKDTYADHRRRLERVQLLEDRKLQIVQLMKSLQPVGGGPSGLETESGESNTKESNGEIAVSNADSAQPTKQLLPEQKEVRYKKPTESDYIFGFRGDVFMCLLEMKVLNDNPNMSYFSERMESLQLERFCLFLERKMKKDDTVNGFDFIPSFRV